MDTDIFLFFNQHYCDYLDGVMPAITHRFTWIAMYIAIAVSVIVTLGVRRGLMFIIAIGLGIALADQLGASLIRPLVCRLRPSNIDSPLAGIVHIVNGYRGGAYGMPSCHAANTVCLLSMLAMRFRSRVLFSVMTLWVVLQIYSRMYLGVHYPSDLLVGSLLGFLSAVIVTAAYHRLTGEERQRESLRLWQLPVAVFTATLVVCLCTN